jgi:hypothetical protein
MLEAFCQFLDGMSNVDDGVESVLTAQAFDGLLLMIQSLYGEKGKDAFENMFTQREDGSLVMSSGDGQEFKERLFN